MPNLFRPACNFRREPSSRAGLARLLENGLVRRLIPRSGIAAPSGYERLLELGICCLNENRRY
jgi:hypothetical protein